MKDRVIDIQIPDAWNKLNLKQLKFAAKLISKGVNPLYTRQLFFIKYGNVKPLQAEARNRFGDKYFLWKEKKTKQYFWFGVKEYTWYLRQLDYLGKESNLSNQLLPMVRVFGRKYFGPSRKLFNLTYNEFIHAELCFNRYIESKNLKDLNALCAVLYRRGSGLKVSSENYKGDLRISFNDFTYMRHAKLWRFVPLWKRVAIFLFYTGSREELYQAHPNLRQSTTVGAIQKSDMDQHRALINTLNQGDITKNKQVLQSLVWDVMAMLDRMVEQNNQLKKK